MVLRAGAARQRCRRAGRRPAARAGPLLRPGRRGLAAHHRLRRRQGPGAGARQRRATYFAADAAYYLSKKDRGFDEKIYLLGADHHGYINRLKAIAACAGDDKEHNIEVRIGQLVDLNGVKRAQGNIIELRDLVSWIGTDAIRYSLARYPADSPLSIEGEELRKQTNENPVFYVQYAHARTSNVHRLAAEDGVRLEDGFDPSLLTHENEAALLAILGDFPGSSPRPPGCGSRTVARYLEDLAGRLHKWYDTCRIRPMTHDEEVTDLHRTRLWLNDATRQVLATALTCLGSRLPSACESGARTMRAHEAGALHAEGYGGPPHWLPWPSDVMELLPQLWPQTVRRDGSGRLEVGGVDVVTIAREFGTAAYVIDEEDFRARARAFREDFAAPFSEVGASTSTTRARPSCAARSPAGSPRRASASTSAPVASSPWPSAPSRRADRPARNNKSLAEIQQALEYGVGRIVVDSFEEIDRIAAVATELGVRAPVMVRVTVGVEAHTHEFIATAHEDQKFGFSLAGGHAAEAVERILGHSQALDLQGLHSHIGSQIFDTSGFEVSARRLIALHAQVAEKHGVHLPEMDLGGGFGIAYTSEHTPLSPGSSASSSPTSSGASSRASATAPPAHRSRGSRSSRGARSPARAPSRSTRSAPSRTSTSATA